LCIAIGPSAHLHLAIPVLVFCFLIVLSVSLLHISDAVSGVPPSAFLTVNTSRAPPLA